MSQSNKAITFKRERVPIRFINGTKYEVEYLEWESVFKNGSHIGNAYRHVGEPYFEPLHGVHLVADDLDGIKSILLEEKESKDGANG